MQRLKTIGLLLFLAVSIRLNAEDRSSPVSYRLKVTIEPDAGSIAVQGSIDVPLQDPAASHFRFNLHETLTVKKLLVNGKQATFADAPLESEIPLAASRGVVVNLPAGLPERRVHMEIEYGGRMKPLPEFNATRTGGTLSMIKSIGCGYFRTTDKCMWNESIRL